MKNIFNFFKSSFNPYKEIGSLKKNLKKIAIYKYNPRFLLYRLKWHLLGGVPFKTRSPIHVDIETASACNLKCVMCPHGAEGYKQNIGIMKDGVARKIIKDCIASGVTSIKFSGRGEATLHKNLVDYVEMAKAGGILDVMFNTNALLLTPEKSKALVDAGIDLIIISIDGTTKETYENIRKGSNFETVVNNVKSLLEYRKMKRKRQPMVRLQFVKMDENIHEFDSFVSYWQDKVDVLVGIDYSNRIKQKDKSVQKRKKAGRAYCPHPFRRLSINYRGDALMCCVDWDSKYKVGDMTTQTLDQVWNGERFGYGRKCIKALEHHKILSCKNCFSPISYEWVDIQHGGDSK